MQELVSLLALWLLGDMSCDRQKSNDRGKSRSKSCAGNIKKDLEYFLL